jgi:hypothetical protein
MAAHSVTRDPTLSMAARLVWTILDGRQGNSARVRVRLATLADDLGAPLSTTRRALDELRARGLITRTRTGAANWWSVDNPARVRAVDSQSAHQRTIRVLTGEHSTKQELLRDKQASKHAAAKVPVAAPAPAPAAAADPPRQTDRPARVAPAAPTLPAAPPMADALAVETYRDLLPRHLRPKATATVARHIGLALVNGWTVTDLAAATTEEIPNPNVRPALTVSVLGDLAQQPAREQTPTTSTTSTRGPWCGNCDDDRTRRVELDDGRVARCPECHPLRDNLDLQQAAAARAEAQGIPLADPMAGLGELVALVSAQQLRQATRAT